MQEEQESGLLVEVYQERLRVPGEKCQLCQRAMAKVLSLHNRGRGREEGSTDRDAVLDDVPDGKLQRRDPKVCLLN